MKTPEDIKKGLEYCYSAKPCVDCKYDQRDFPHCVRRLLKDAVDGYKQLESRLAQVERERDAAVADIPHYCHLCRHNDRKSKHNAKRSPCSRCRTYDSDGCFEWRGVCEENTKEDV